MVVNDPYCFCVPLRAGTFVLAYLNLTQLYGGIIFSIFVLVAGAGNQKSPEGKMAQSGTIILSIGAVLFIVFFLSFCFASILLAGLYRVCIAKSGVKEWRTKYLNGNAISYQKKLNYVKAYVIYNRWMSRIIILLCLIFGLLGAIEGFAIILVAFNYNSIISTYHEKMLEESLCRVDTV